MEQWNTGCARFPRSALVLFTLESSVASTAFGRCKGLCLLNENHLLSSYSIMSNVLAPLTDEIAWGVSLYSPFCTHNSTNDTVRFPIPLLIWLRSSKPSGLRTRSKRQSDSGFGDTWFTPTVSWCFTDLARIEPVKGHWFVITHSV